MWQMTLHSIVSPCRLFCQWIPCTGWACVTTLLTKGNWRVFSVTGLLTCDMHNATDIVLFHGSELGSETLCFYHSFLLSTCGWRMTVGQLLLPLNNDRWDSVDKHMASHEQSRTEVCYVIEFWIRVNLTKPVRNIHALYFHWKSIERKKTCMQYFA